MNTLPWFLKILKTNVKRFSSQKLPSYDDFIKYSHNFDIGRIFIDSNIQTIIKNINMETMDINKVFLPNKQKREMATIKLLTTDQYEQLIDDAKIRALEKLQPPTFLLPRSPIEGFLKFDKEIENFDTSTYVFTDITFGINNRDRFIVVREPNGFLRKATWEERDRMNQIYFPKERRELHLPKMFEPEYFQDALEKGKYIFVLDRILTQFEPDHPLYLPLMFQTFDHVIKNGHLKELVSTRYFGSLVLYQALKNDVDDILIYILESCNKKDLFDQSLLACFYVLSLHLNVVTIIESNVKKTTDKPVNPENSEELLNPSTIHNLNTLEESHSAEEIIKILNAYISQRQKLCPDHSKLEKIENGIKNYLNQCDQAQYTLKKQRI